MSKKDKKGTSNNKVKLDKSQKKEFKKGKNKLNKLEKEIKKKVKSLGKLNKEIKKEEKDLNKLKEKKEALLIAIKPSLEILQTEEIKETEIEKTESKTIEPPAPVAKKRPVKAASKTSSLKINEDKPL